MIKLLEPKDVAQHWKLIEFAVVGKLEPLTRANSDQVKKALLEKLLVCFALMEPEKAEPLRGFVVCAIGRDILTNEQFLITLGAFAVLDVELKTWSDVMVSLIGFAKQNKCGRIVGYTQSEQILSIAQQFGAVSSFNYMDLTLEG